ncbi:MAG: PEP-CTERM sorting domain-containing protein [Gemmatimonadota bacterium]
MRHISSVALISVLIASPLAAQTFQTGTSAVGTQDANWLVSWTSGPYGPGGNSGGSYGAWVVPAVGGVWEPDEVGSGAKWISAWPSSSAVGGVGDYNKDTDAGLRYFYTFEVTFNSLFAGNLLLSAGWDNILTGFVLNGTTFNPTTALTSSTDRAIGNHFGFCRDGDAIFNSSDYPLCTANFSLPGLLAGSNTLKVTLKGDGQTDGLWLTGDTPVGATEIVPEPATMSLLATGLLGLAGAGVKRRKRPARDEQL